MGYFDIALSGLEVAQRSMSLIGTNIANAFTEGYHRQTAEIRPRVLGGASGASLAGAEIATISRHVDILLEQEMLRQQPIYGQIQQELRSLQTIEAAFGNLESENLAAAMTKFFGSLAELSAQTTSGALREQAVANADSMAGQFRNIAEFLTGLTRTVRQEADVLVAQANALIDEIADMNGQVRNLELKGGNSNILRDQRDRAIHKLGELVGIQAGSVDQSAVMANVVVWGTPLVTGTRAVHLEAGTADGGNLGIAIEGTGRYGTDYSGGRIGGLLALINEIIPEVQDKLDTLAKEIVIGINRCHVEGVGMSGSMTGLTGVAMSAETLSEWSMPVVSGDFRVRLIDTSGSATVHTVTVDASTDTLATVAAKIAALDPAHLSATVAASVLRMQALGGYKFDFLPVTTADTTGLAGPGAPSVTMGGIYTGSADETYTVTVAVSGGGSGQVGITSGLTLTVRNAAAEVVKILDVGVGYANGDELEIDHGLKISLSPGALNDGETFTIDAPAYSDQTGFLAAAGMNTFFSGISASTIAVRRELLADSNLLATAIGGDMNDNVNVARMSRVGQTGTSALDGMAPASAFQILVTNIGERVAVHKAKQSAIESVLQQLINHRDTISGVDINDEAARLLIFERMYRSMAQVIQVQERALQSLMDLL